MSELKTLKDIKWIREDLAFLKQLNLLVKLKDNAVKRAKHWNLRWKQLEKLDGKDSYNAGYFKGMRDEVMEANNLTDKDLEENRE